MTERVEKVLVEIEKPGREVGFRVKILSLVLHKMNCIYYKISRRKQRSA